jgi:hypothetical protein
MQFRSAIRDLPASVVNEFLSLPKNPELERIPKYFELLRLILFHQLPRTEEERLAAQAETHRAFEEMERRDAQVRDAAREQKLAGLAEKRRIAAEKHRQRGAESARRRQFREQVASMPVARRIDVLVANPGLSPVFFSILPEEINDELIARMNPADRAALALRIAPMRHRRWRELRTRLLHAV